MNSIAYNAIINEQEREIAGLRAELAAVKAALAAAPATCPNCGGKDWHHSVECYTGKGDSENARLRAELAALAAPQPCGHAARYVATDGKTEWCALCELDKALEARNKNAADWIVESARADRLEAALKSANQSGSEIARRNIAYWNRIQLHRRAARKVAQWARGLNWVDEYQKRIAAERELAKYKADVCKCGHLRSEHSLFVDHCECNGCGSDEGGCEWFEPDVPISERRTEQAERERDAARAEYRAEVANTVAQANDLAELRAALDALRAACAALVDYRHRAGALGFQLEKADDHINAIAALLPGHDPRSAANGGAGDAERQP